MPHEFKAVLHTLNRLIAEEARGDSVYLILDAARGVDVPALAREMGAECRSLYSGESGDHLADVAPYLLPVSARSRLLEWFAGEWGRAVGVLLRSRLDMNGVRDHLRTLLIVKEPESGERCLFRFYDPRALRSFLPECSAEEAREFFGPVAAWWCENADGGEALVFAPGSTKVMMRGAPIDA